MASSREAQVNVRLRGSDLSRLDALHRKTMPAATRAGFARWLLRAAMDAAEKEAAENGGGKRRTPSR